MLSLLFIVSSSIMFSASLAYTPEGYISFPYFLKYGIAMTWFIISVVRKFVSKKGRIEKKQFNDIGVYSIPSFLMLLSIVAGIFLRHTLSDVYIARSFSNLLTTFSIILCVYGSVEIFGEKTIDYTFYGLLLSTAINIVCTSYLYGFGNVIVALGNIFTIVGFGYENGSILSNVGYSLEVSDATFAYGFYFLYYLLFVPKSKRKYKRIFLSLFGIYVGLKRIEIFAILIAICYYYMLEKQKKKTKQLQYLFFGIFLLISFVYLALIKYHTEIFAILDTHRVALYSQLRNMYELSPAYVGAGYGYVNKWLSVEGAKLWILTVSHSDIVRIYIELGFVGFILWIYYYSNILPNYFAKNDGICSSKIVHCFAMYLLITYLIDNTLMLFATQYTFMMIPVALNKGFVRHKCLKIKSSYK